MYVQQMLFMFNDKLYIERLTLLQRSWGMSPPSHMILCPYLILRQMSKKLFKSVYKPKRICPLSRNSWRRIYSVMKPLLPPQSNFWDIFSRYWFAWANTCLDFRTQTEMICEISEKSVLWVPFLTQPFYWNSTYMSAFSVLRAHDLFGKNSGCVLSFKGWPGWLSPWISFRRWFSHGWVFPRWCFRDSTAVSSKSFKFSIRPLRSFRRNNLWEGRNV